MKSVLCFGEVLWDILPSGRHLGGAPLNVAYHLGQLGFEPLMVSAVGDDALGEEARRAVEAGGVKATALSRHPVYPTGSALVTLDATGQATYELPMPAAWDAIPVQSVLSGPSPDAIIFGTLALRGRANRDALGRVLAAFPDAWVVCDLNLRSPFDDLTELGALLGRARLLKFNADEARRLGEVAEADDAPDWQSCAQRLSRRFDGAAICVTLGDRGAGLWMGGTWFEARAKPVQVADTIGAGDAFTAALVAGRLRRGGSLAGWPETLRDAVALGAYVASCHGAQPSHDGFDRHVRV